MRRPSSQAARSTSSRLQSRESGNPGCSASASRTKAKTSAPNASRSARTSAPTMLRRSLGPHSKAPVRSASPSRLAVGSSATASSRRLTSPDSAAAGPRPLRICRDQCRCSAARAGVRLQHDQVGPAGEVGLLRRMQGLAGKLEEPQHPADQPGIDAHATGPFGSVLAGSTRLPGISRSRSALGARRHANQPPAASSASSSAAPTPTRAPTRSGEALRPSSPRPSAPARGRRAAH